ncbi:hypothetical protein K4H28_01635 [Deefgea tanakiae]|uniref:Uncharacterized protein n=1 Tax=Deefgea tanakiae TaxID=2865840 RepID=A0ABX8Z6E9_9NEIS|nr:hypothetical protein [Deefgea tanakiae]QZA78159.1 hypothetical protein K4H28_01635 [Deefgea tanakiae]
MAKIKSTTEEESVEDSQNGKFAKKEITGVIAQHIGTGKNAKDSFVWMTITWSFRIALTISLCFFAQSFFDPTYGKNILDSIIKVWSIFVPIITLALGYAFGKGK